MTSQAADPFDPASITRPEPALMTYYAITAAMTVVGFPFVVVPMYLAKLRRSTTGGLGDDDHHRGPLTMGATAWSPEHIALLREIRSDLTSLNAL